MILGQLCAPALPIPFLRGDPSKLTQAFSNGFLNKASLDGQPTRRTMSTCLAARSLQ